MENETQGISRLERHIQSNELMERILLSEAAALSPVFAAIDKENTPPRSMIKVIEYDEHLDSFFSEISWYLNSADFDPHEQVVITEVHKLRLERAKLNAQVRVAKERIKYLRVKATADGIEIAKTRTVPKRKPDVDPNHPYGVTRVKDVEIIVTSDDDLTVKTPKGVWKNQYRSALGFNKINSRKPSVNWKLLLHIATFPTREFPRENTGNKTLPDDLRRLIPRFNACFRDAFGVNDDAIGKCKDGFYTKNLDIRDSTKRDPQQNYLISELEKVRMQEQDPPHLRNRVLHDKYEDTE